MVLLCWCSWGLVCVCGVWVGVVYLSGVKLGRGGAFKVAFC